MVAVPPLFSICAFLGTCAQLEKGATMGLIPPSSMFPAALKEPIAKESPQFLSKPSFLVKPLQAERDYNDIFEFLKGDYIQLANGEEWTVLEKLDTLSGKSFLLKSLRGDKLVIKSFLSSGRHAVAKEKVELEWKIINHPVVNLGAGDITIDSESGRYLLPMKYVEGESFEIAFLNGHIKPAQLFSIEKQVNQFLDKLHAAGIVHGLPSARNIILRNNNYLDPVLIDYGVAIESTDPKRFQNDKQIFGGPFFNPKDIFGAPMIFKRSHHN